MTLDLLRERGVALERQVFTWRELASPPFSKLDDDAFTRVRAVLMSAVEAEAVRFSHACARVRPELRAPLGRVRRVEHHQQTLIAWLTPPDQSPLETTVAIEQASVELTAAAAQLEPDPALAQVYRYGLLDDLDHLYRCAALLDRVAGQDPNTLLQGYTDIRPGRPAALQHRAPDDDAGAAGRRGYDRRTAAPASKLAALTVLALAEHARGHYLAVGPQLADPLARELYAEIAALEEQHVTMYEALTDPGETPLERWLLHEAGEVLNYWGCLRQETNPALREIWQRFVDYELGHLHLVMDLMREHEGRDPAALLPAALPEPFSHESQRAFVRRTLAAEADLRAAGAGFVDAHLESPDAPSVRWREQMGREGTPSEIVAAGYRWTPGTELCARAAELAGRRAS
jgi:hypothetical protein